MGKVIGRQFERGEGRSIFVGKRDDGSSDRYVQLKNGTAVTRLKLTEEGAALLSEMLHVENEIGEPAEYDVGDAESTLRTWQLVKELHD